MFSDSGCDAFRSGLESRLGTSILEGVADAGSVDVVRVDDCPSVAESCMVRMPNIKTKLSAAQPMLIEFLRFRCAKCLIIRIAVSLSTKWLSPQTV